MANKRTLKRGIHLICEELFAECIAAIHYGDNDPENGQALLCCIIDMQNDFISRVSHPEPGMPAWHYYKRLRSDFSEHVNELIDQINN